MFFNSHIVTLFSRIRYTMRMKRILIVACGLFFLAPPAFALATPKSGFDDVPVNHINSEAVIYMRAQGVVQGYSDGTFRPDGMINRAEFAKIALGSMSDFLESELEECVSSAFKDVRKGEWYAPWVCAAKKRGLIHGYPDGTFRPAAQINFVEASKIIQETRGTDSAGSPAAWEPWFADYVKSLEAARAIPVTVDQFGKKLARGEMAEIMWRVREHKTDLDSRTFDSLETNTQLAIGDFPKISSCDELEYRISQRARNNGATGLKILSEPAMPDGTAESAMPSEAGGGAREFSQTNVQVSGVDEADIVKNDGEYIYMVKDSEVIIVRAFPANELSEVSRIKFENGAFSATQLYLDGDLLAVIGLSSYPYRGGIEESRLQIFAPEFYGGSRSKVFIVDVADRKNPKVKRAIEFEGDYQTSRKVGDTLYMVVDVRALSDNRLLPAFGDFEGGGGTNGGLKPIAGCGDVRYFPGFTQPNYLIVAAIDVDDFSKEVEREVYLGAAENVFASKENLYVAEAHYDNALEIHNKVGLWTPPEEYTAVYRFSLSPGDIAYEGRGKVPGHILNQFSMDEFRGNFRIATTKSSAWGPIGNQTDNNVYVLDSGFMNIVGRLEGIAPGERIYSTRFIGDRLYMVTFRQVDPFFVIDLSSSRAPKILGYLKIPGYSDYLHPYDENHILGFGKDTGESFEPEVMATFPVPARPEGVKVALFDVSDVERPALKFKMVIGKHGSDSELLYDHKALLFDKAKGFFAFPVQLAEEYRTYFKGAHAYDIDLENGFNLRGEATHYDDGAFDREYFYGEYEKDIQRIIYIGNHFYTISPGMIKALAIDDVTEAGRLNIK